jgi:hypothetical protein
MNEKLTAEIHALLCRFQQAFDTHDWRLLSECLAEELFTDYSSFRGTLPGRVAREDYIALRKDALSGLKMQHNFSNLQLALRDGQVQGRCNYSIYRFAQKEVGETRDGYFHSFGSYVFEFQQGERGGGWVISSIVQVLLANQGNPTLHLAAAELRRE